MESSDGNISRAAATFWPRRERRTGMEQQPDFRFVEFKEVRTGERLKLEARGPVGTLMGLGEERGGERETLIEWADGNESRRLIRTTTMVYREVKDEVT